MSRTALSARTPVGARGLATALVATTLTAALGGCSVLTSMVKGGESDPGRGIAAGNLVVVEPDPGRPRVAPTKATWCQVVDPESVDNLDGWRITSAMKGMLERSAWGQPGTWAAQTLCAPIDDDGVRQQTAYFLQAWVNWTGASEADVKALMLYFANDKRYEEGRTMACSKLAVSSEASSHDKYTAKAMAQFFGCEGFPAWWLPTTDVAAAPLVEDAPTAPSETIHAYAQLQCAGSLTDDQPYKLVRYAACRLDSRPIDARKLAREMAPYGEWAQIMGRLAVGRAALEMKRAEEVAAAAAKQDAAWQTLLFDVPTRAWKAWHESYQANARIFQDAAAFETIVDGPSRNAVEGCLAPAWKNLRGYVAAQKPRTAADVRRILGDHVGARAVDHIVACAKAHQITPLTAIYQPVDANSAPFHGPRAAAAFALAQAVDAIRRDRDKFLSDEFGAGKAGAWDESALRSLTPTNTKGAVVKSVVKKGANLEVTFVTRRWKEDSQDCVSTGKLLGYNDDGTPYFQQRCGKVYKVERSETPSPDTFPAELGAAIKPGVLVVSYSSFPVEVWSSAAKKKLLAYLGQPL